MCLAWKNLPIDCPGGCVYLLSHQQWTRRVPVASQPCQHFIPFCFFRVSHSGEWVVDLISMSLMSNGADTFS